MNPERRAGVQHLIATILCMLALIAIFAVLAAILHGCGPPPTTETLILPSVPVPEYTPLPGDPPPAKIPPELTGRLAKEIER